MSSLANDDDSLPRWVDPARLADQQSELCGTLNDAALPRLKNLGHRTDLAHAVVRFSRRGGQQFQLQGMITFTVELVCQRCLEPFTLDLHSDLDLDLNDCDWHAEDDPRLDLIAILEDEIMLACPMIALHEISECRAQATANQQARSCQPFRALAELLANSASRKP